MKINDIYKDSIFGDTNTFFYLWEQNENNVYPLVQDFISGHVAALNMDFFGGYSADKYISPLLEKIYESSQGAEYPFNVINNRIANILYNRFAIKWKKIYDALLTTYNPLENYSMEEVRTPDLTFDETQSEKNKSTSDRTTSATSKYKGFNADEPITITKTDGSENVVTSGSKEDNEIHKVSEHTGTETLTRAGNIGVTTSQQMLESEFKVRQYDFYKMIYNDIDSILCLSIY